MARSDISQLLKAESAQLPTGKLLDELQCLSRFITTRIIHHFGRHEFMPSYSDEHKRANLLGCRCYYNERNIKWGV